MSFIEILFIGVGTLSVAFAVGMLLTEKAVHSAMFLIANFVCVALIYLMLDAPFLAMVQIAVYAGAIMVLFLFVIMLLGAEQPSTNPKTFKWLTPTTLVLATGFLLVVALVLLGSGIDNKDTSPQTARLRFVNALSVYPNADFYLGGDVVAQGIRFGEIDGRNALRFMDVAPGTYLVGATLANSAGRPFPLGQVTINAGETLTVIAYGYPGTDVAPTLLTVNEDVSATNARVGRVTIVNAHAPAQTIAVLQAGSDRTFRTPADADAAPVVVESLGVGQVAQFAEELPGVRYWVMSDANQRQQILARPSGRNGRFEVVEGASQLLIYASDRQGDITSSIAMNIVTPNDYAFGSPQALGQLMFVEYMLPFQMVGILLLTAMVGAIVVAQRSVSKPKPGRPTRRKVSRPLTSVITAQTGTDVTLADESPKLPEPEQEATELAGD